MQWRRTGVVAGALALSLAACEEHIAAPSHDDAERAALVQRTLNLKASVATSGRLTTNNQRDLEALRQDIIAWQTRTGRSDLSVSSFGPAAGTIASAAVAQVGGASDDCACPSITYSGGKICFLSMSGGCAPGDLHWCAYICITIAPPGTPVRRA